MKISKLLNYLTFVMLPWDIIKMQRFESMPPVLRLDLQAELIKRILTTARQCFKSYGALDSQAHLAEYPILSKDQLRSLQGIYKPMKRFYVTSASGGSTGKPMTVAQSLYYWRINRANKFYIYMKSSGQILPKVAKLWGEDNPSKRSAKRLYLWLTRTKIYNTFSASEKEYTIWLQELNQEKPDILEGYASSLDDFLIHTSPSQTKWQPKVVLSSAGVLTPTLIRNIRKRWPTVRIVNRYGSREVGDIAWGISDSGFDAPRLYINQLTHKVEVVDSEGCACQPGEVGRILVTQLVNHAYPLVRYDLGDLGVLNLDENNCPYLSSLVGRTVDVFKGNNGERVDGEFFTHLFYGIDLIDSFQVIQSTQGIDINVRMPVDELPDNCMKSIEAKVGKVLPGVPIVWRMNQEFTKDPSGKVRFTRCEI
jgi:phenylacetate-CoA ligase